MEEKNTQSNMPPQEEEMVTPQESMAPEEAPQPPVIDDKPVTDIDEHKLFAAISYLGILVVIPLFMKKDDPFVRFHAKQGLVLFIGFIVSSLLTFMSSIVSNLLFLLLIILSIIGLVQSLQGRRWQMPVIGDLADKFDI